jgi:hypothetical protein
MTNPNAASVALMTVSPFAPRSGTVAALVDELFAYPSTQRPGILHVCLPAATLDGWLLARSYPIRSTIRASSTEWWA